ncbi:MAG: DUF4350 domain-containing protein [Candidatus Thiodiazotropha sp.]
MSRVNSSHLAMGLVALLIIGGYSWWFLANFEQETYQRRSEMSEQARRNPLLAAERLLNRLGQQAESRSGRQYLIQPPEESGVLLVRDLGAPLPADRVDALLAWVEAGGQLIATPGRLQSDELRRPLLEAFGVELVNLWDIEGLDWLKDVADEGDAEQKPTQAIVLPNGNETPLEIEFDSDRRFEVDYDGDYWQAPSEGDPHLLIFPYGRGYVTFLSDSGFFDNGRIGDYDHAPLLAELADGPERVWLLYSSQMPSLLELIWRWAPYLVVSLLLFVGLSIWHMGRRSGPRIVSGQQQRRDLLEHLQAAAQFNWRTDPSASLLQQARKQVEKRWMISHPQLHHLDRDARCEWLAERTGMTPEAIELALYNAQTEGGQLIKITANLQRLLTALHPQGNKR